MGTIAAEASGRGPKEADTWIEGTGPLNLSNGGKKDKPCSKPIEEEDPSGENSPGGPVPPRGRAGKKGGSRAAIGSKGKEERQTKAEDVVINNMFWGGTPAPQGDTPSWGCEQGPQGSRY